MENSRTEEDRLTRFEFVPLQQQRRETGRILGMETRQPYDQRVVGRPAAVAPRTIEVTRSRLESAGHSTSTRSAAVVSSSASRR